MDSRLLKYGGAAAACATAVAAGTAAYRAQAR